MLYLPERRVTACCFGILLYGRLVSSSPSISLFSHLYISAWTMDIYFILRVIMQYFFTAQIVPTLAVRSFFSWLLCPFNVPPPALSTFLLSGTIRWPCSSFIFLPSPRSSHFSKEPRFPYWRAVLETKVWCAHCY